MTWRNRSGQILHGLKVREDGKPAGKLAYYSGAGSLGGWLRAVVGQLAIDQHRRQSRLVQTEEDADLERMAHDAGSESGWIDSISFSSGPEESLANTMHRPTWKGFGPRAGRSG